MDELTSSEYFLRLTDGNTYGINTIKNPYSSENKEKIAVVPYRILTWRSKMLVVVC